MGIALILTFLLLLSNPASSKEINNWYLPIAAKNRQSVAELSLTSIGMFGEPRQARGNIPAHLHTGIDIRRTSKNFDNEPIFPASNGIVISIRDDGPYAQIIIEHNATKEKKVWTVYEHVSGIVVTLGQKVSPNNPVARFMNRKELDQYGWQFNHFHFEVMKLKPVPVAADGNKPLMKFATHWLQCRTYEELNKRYYNPLEFFDNSFQLRMAAE